MISAKPPRRSGSETRRMTAQIPLRLLPDDAERLHRLAVQTSRSVGDIVRTLVLAELDRYPYNVCPRCSNGRPLCEPPLDYGPFVGMDHGQRHAALCAMYLWAAEVCDKCKSELDDEFRAAM